MGYQKLQVGRITAMDDKVSDYSDGINLNDPILDAAGAPKDYTIASFANVPLGSIYYALTVTGATFITDGVKAGDLAYNATATLASGRIVQVNSETEIVVEGIVAAPTQVIRILKGSTEPAVLYVGTNPGAGAVTLKVTTEGGDDITFHNTPEGSFLPVQVKRVWKVGTTVTDILALF